MRYFDLRIQPIEVPLSEVVVIPEAPEVSPATQAARSSLRTDLDSVYADRLTTFLAEHGRYPSRQEDFIWGGQQDPVITNARISELRTRNLSEKVRKGGKGSNQIKALNLSSKPVEL